jgi:hypothetical protein
MWEYDPVPRYRFYLGDTLIGEVELDHLGSHACNNFNKDGEVWRAVIGDDFFGRFPSLKEAQDAVRERAMNRGLKLV